MTMKKIDIAATEAAREADVNTARRPLFVWMTRYSVVIPIRSPLEPQNPVSG